MNWICYVYWLLRHALIFFSVQMVGMELSGFRFSDFILI